MGWWGEAEEIKDMVHSYALRKTSKYFNSRKIKLELLLNNFNIS